MSVTGHRQAAPHSVDCSILVVSDTRTLETDRSGRLIAELLESAGHAISSRHVARDEPADVTRHVRSWLALGGGRALILTGSTGISPRDVAADAVSALLEKPLPGFGELFRMLSFAEIGAAAMLSRATAGTVGSNVLFALPGSEHAVRLAMTRLVLPELGHIISELQKDDRPS